MKRLTLLLHIIVITTAIFGCRNTGSTLSDGGLGGDGRIPPRYTVKAELEADKTQFTSTRKEYERAGKPKPETRLAITEIAEYDNFEKIEYTVDEMQENDKRILKLLEELEDHYKIKVPKVDMYIRTWDKNDEEYKLKHKLDYIKSNSLKLRRRLKEVEDASRQ